MKVLREAFSSLSSPRSCIMTTASPPPNRLLFSFFHTWAWRRKDTYDITTKVFLQILSLKALKKLWKNLEFSIRNVSNNSKTTRQAATFRVNLIFFLLLCPIQYCKICNASIGNLCEIWTRKLFFMSNTNNSCYCYDLTWTILALGPESYYLVEILS